MKILISEHQYTKMVMELLNHHDGHDIQQREHRMNLLQKGIPVVIDYNPTIMKKVGNSHIPIPQGDKSKIVGKYVLTPEISSLLNQRLDDIYKYKFENNQSFAILVYDFLLDTNDVYTNKIIYDGEPDSKTIRDEVMEIMKKKKSWGVKMSFTEYEPIDKKNPDSKLSKEHRGNYLVMVIDRNMALTIFLTSKKKWDEKDLYGMYKYDIKNFIRFDQISNYAKLLPRYRKDNTDGDVNNDDVKEMTISKEIKESWIMEWINSTNKK